MIIADLIEVQQVRDRNLFIKSNKAYRSSCEANSQKEGEFKKVSW